MTALIDRIIDHKAFKTLDNLEKLLENASLPEGLDLYIVESFQKAKAVIGYLNRRLDVADPLLIPLTVLNSLDDSLQQATHSITAYLTTDNVGQWSNALSQLDSCVAQVSSIPAQTVEGVDSMRTSAAEFRASIENLFLNTKADADGLSKMQFDLQQKILEASTEISNQKQRLDTAITAFQQQFSDSQQTRQSEFASSEQSRLATAQSSEETRQMAFENTRQQYVEGFEKVSSLASKAHTDLVEALKATAQDALDTIETQKKHAEKLVGIITNTGMAYGFQKTANEERTQSYIWSGIAVVAMSIWIITGCVFFWFTYDKELTLPSVIRQFLISTPFVLLSGFAALRVAQHQKNERSMRKSELEIASIDPFLATLSDQDRNEVKREFATRYFGQHETQEKQEKVPANLIELAGSLVKVVQDLAKK